MIKPFQRVLPLCAFALTATLLFTACNRNPEPRRYREIVLKGGNPNLQHGPLGKFAWTLPAGWTVQPEGDPMRLTGFWAPDPALVAKGETDPKPVDVSIVQLEGDAGGLEANVTRWLGQVALSPTLAKQAIAEALPIKTATGQTGIVVDFTPYLSDDLTQSKSIIGAILDGGDNTVFVKAMGARSHVPKIKAQLLEFCQNLSITTAAEDSK
jgi:hypothetical protein